MVDALQSHKLKSGKSVTTFTNEIGRVLEVTVKGLDRAEVESKEVRDIVVSLRKNFEKFTKAGMDPNPSDSSTPTMSKKKKLDTEYKRVYRFVAI